MKITRLTALFLLVLVQFSCENHKEPVVDFTYTLESGNLHVPAQVNFFSSTGPGWYYYWNFGDGDSSISENVGHIFDSAGIYQVKYRVAAHYYDYGDEITKTIEILPAFTTLNIADVTLTGFAWVAPDTYPWDTFSIGDTLGDPDVYFKIKDGSSNVIYTSSIVPNTIYNPSYPIDFTLPALNDNYTFELYDDDSGTSEFMGSVAFNPFLNILSQPNPYPSSKEIGSVETYVLMNFQWQ